MRYIGRLIVYISIFFITFSLISVVLAGLFPVMLTPLKTIRYFENFTNMGPKIDSNWVPLDRISESMVQAVIATEDNNFLKHNGFDWKAIKQAIKDNRKKNKVRGGSTISQQTAKNLFCPPDRTWLRKGFEAFYTFLIESLWSKQRIMEVYLNIIETGPNMYGVEAPARKIYKKKASELNRYDASMIATVLPSPQRMLLSSPSSYMTRRSAQVRNLMSKLPPLEF